MNLIEMIHVRSFSAEDRQKAIDLFDGLSLKGDNTPGRISLFKHESLPTDLNICLYWDTDNINWSRSDFCQTLSSAFKYFGWISHSIWTPLKEKTSC
ncbi:MAG: hypothetical protein D3926_09545 [Desulfobacteraceae bacterium]|nr:MAG: hypothetical protein D3926_09545 [Desulfobacteraceae bacterium]